MKLPTRLDTETSRPRDDRSRIERLDAKALARDLERAVRGEVRFDDGSRALYATDSSNYRQVPIGVVTPRRVEDVFETLELCREVGVTSSARRPGS